MRFSITTTKPAKPETMEEFLATLPPNAEVSFRQVGRYHGRASRYEMKYVQYDSHWGRRAVERYMYTGEQPLECVKKLRKKQKNPGCRVDCTCVHHREDD